MSGLLDRAGAPEVRNASPMTNMLGSLVVDELVDEYLELKETAPRRGEDGFRYFVERAGRPPQDERAFRREERLAMALTNDQVSLTLGSETVELLMYAFPLFTSGGPKRIRGVDLVGHAPKTQRFWVVELKVEANSGYGETPLRALYEALIYGAVVEANMDYITGELDGFGRKVDQQRPGLLITAPEQYWERWAPNRRIGDWWSPYRSITEALSDQLKTPLETLSLGRVTYKVDANGMPRLDGLAECELVRYSSL